METEQHILTPRQQVDRIISNLEYLLNNLELASKQFSKNRLQNLILSLNGLLRVSETIEDVAHASALKYKICQELNFLFMYCNLTDNENLDSRTKLIVDNVLNDISLIGFNMNNQYYVGQKIIEKIDFIIHYENEVGIKVFKVMSAVDEDTARSDFNENFPFLTIISVGLFDDWCSKIGEKTSKI